MLECDVLRKCVQQSSHFAIKYPTLPISIPEDVDSPIQRISLALRSSLLIQGYRPNNEEMDPQKRTSKAGCPFSSRTMHGRQPGALLQDWRGEPSRGVGT
ncbi:hypothetical protein K443DRAFT_598771 [Laccaria amethystina LaAM-08-1]|uniref:Uncharacterized protein n=1 Tax=Laccaria amethystina LaAM-08-1 TaxID=1095629 RepID=A0A0C9XXS3_9AGAR|nr:hypothetical protein K443DRAFT_598771 [Laccaria amethystina LaAM-08-1]